MTTAVASIPPSTTIDDEPRIPSEPMTADEFEKWAFAQELATYEWVRGEIIMMAPVSDWHNDLNRWLIVLLSLFVEDRGLGVVRFDMFFRMTDSRRVPDLFVLKEENRSRLTPSALNGPADLAIEIISKDSGARDWRIKFLEYEAAGVAEYWVIDPVLQVIECYTLGSDRCFGRIEIKDDKMNSLVLPGLFLRPSWLWQKPLPRVAPLLREMGVEL